MPEGQAIVETMLHHSDWNGGGHRFSVGMVQPLRVADPVDRNDGSHMSVEPLPSALPQPSWV